jgi:PAS domain S-box-containing protein
MLKEQVTPLSFHSQLHVLLVEDDLSQATLLRETLGYANHMKLEVIHVTDLRAAKKQLRSGARFDVVLLDLSLPDSRGLTSLTGLLKAAQGVPIVVLTALDDEALAIQAVRSGAQDYLVKHELVQQDLDTGPLVRSIRYAVERAQSDKALRAAYHELEARVEERTKELVAANEALEAEIREREEAQEKFYKAFYANPSCMLITSREDGRVIDANGAFVKSTGFTRNKVVGRTTIELGLWKDSLDRERLLQLLSEYGSVRDFEMIGRTKSGEVRHGLLSVEQMELNGEACLLLTILDITDRKRAEEVLQRSKDELQEEVRARTEQLANANRSLKAEIAQRQRMEDQLVSRAYQQRVVAELGQSALMGTDPSALMDAVVSSVARTLGVEYCKILELLPGGKQVLLRAGVGWKKGYVGNTVLTAGPESQVGYTLLANEPVIVEDLPTETRFKGLPLLHEHGVISGISVIIQGQNGPFGVLGAHTQKRSAFTRDDVSFVQAVANVLAQAIERAQIDDDLRKARDELESKVEERTAALRETNKQLHIELAERKRVTDALKQSEQRYRQMFEGNRSVQWLTDPESGQIVDANVAAVRFYGYTLNELKKLHITDINLTLDMATFREATQKTTENPSYFIFQHRLASGELRDVEVYTSPIDVEGRRLLYSIIHDITERKQSEEALQESEMRFRLVTQATNEVIWDRDLVTGKIWWNDALESLLGYKAEEVSTDYDWWKERMHPDDREEVVSSLDAFTESSGSYWTSQYRIRRADGTYADLVVRKFDVHDEAGVLVRVIGSMMDVTERRRAEEERRAREAAEVANRAKNEFLSRMSHELRTPLNAILGFAQLLELEGLDAGQHESVGYILKAGQHLLNLINEVLDISRIESGRMTMTLESLQIMGVLQEGLDLIRPLAAQRGVQVDTDFSDVCEQQIVADAHRLKQVLLNLLANAVKYNHKGGSVTLSCEVHGDGRVRLSVRDTGPGIPMESISRLFTPFERLGAEQSGVEGIGLGLALSKRLAEAMGGSIGVESTVGQGSVFWVDLPIAGSDVERKKKPGTGPLVASAALEGEHTIVYIEDSLSSLTLIERILAHHPNIRLLSAARGGLGLELAREQHADLVLADLNLPDMSGEEVLRKLREEPQTHTLPVVMVSADASPAQAERMLDAGAQAYLTKPIDVRQFLQVLSDVLTAGPPP